MSKAAAAAQQRADARSTAQDAYPGHTAIHTRCRFPRRLRGGREFVYGKSEVPLAELTEEQAEAILGDFELRPKLV